MHHQTTAYDNEGVVESKANVTLLHTGCADGPLVSSGGRGRRGKWFSCPPLRNLTRRGSAVCSHSQGRVTDWALRLKVNSSTWTTSSLMVVGILRRIPLVVLSSASWKVSKGSSCFYDRGPSCRGGMMLAVVCSSRCCWRQKTGLTFWLFPQHSPILSLP